MPRNAQYDRQAALAQAAALFWAQGYYATSLKQLEQALDMRPASLYAAFGSKQALFLEALDNYAQQLGQQLKTQVNQHSSPLAALKAFIKDSVLGMEYPFRACMVVKTLLEVNTDSPPLYAKANALLVQMEQAFGALLEKAKERGELPANTDCVRLARLLQVQIMGLRAYAQRDLPEDTLSQVLEDVLTLIDNYSH